MKTKLNIIGTVTKYKKLENGAYILNVKYKPYGKKKAKLYNKGHIKGDKLVLYA